MTCQPTLRILAASIALALAGAAHAQAPAAPSTAPAPAPATTSTPATTTTPAPAATPKADKSAPKTQGYPTRRAPSTQGKEAPTGTPGVAAVPGAAPSGGAQTGKSQRTNTRSAQGGSGRQLQNVYADLMTPEEMAAHRAKVKKTKTYAECKTLFDATGKDMEARAKAQSKTVPSTPTEICDKAKERGRFTG